MQFIKSRTHWGPCLSLCSDSGRFHFHSIKKIRMNRLLDLVWAISFCHKSEKQELARSSHPPISSLLAFLVQGRNWWERAWMRFLYESNYFLCSMSLSKPHMLFYVIQHGNRVPLTIQKFTDIHAYLLAEKILGNKTVWWSLMVSHHITWSWILIWKTFTFFSLYEAKTQARITKI